MKTNRMLYPIGSAVIAPAMLAGTILLTGSCALGGQRADTSFDASVAHPAYEGAVRPRVTIDEAHRNFHTAGGRYKPFADLVTQDGYRVKAGRDTFTHEALRATDVLVISNAMGPDEHRDSAAFTPGEVRAVREWVEGGGSLLLIADHWPMGGASAKLSEAFGVDMSQGVTEDTVHCALSTDGSGRKEPTTLSFTRENHLLLDHPVTSGRRPDERVGSVETFTGQSLCVPPGATAFLRLGSTASDRKPGTPRLEKRGGDTVLTMEYGDPENASGRAQGVALPFGKGRVVVLGEAAMMTAQISGDGHPFGMNVPGNDDKKLALNILHWLSRLD